MNIMMILAHPNRESLNHTADCRTMYGVLFSTEAERSQWLDSLPLLVEGL